jgi:hypothetical protein
MLTQGLDTRTIPVLLFRFILLFHRANITRFSVCCQR